jgi:hypothetical protein
MGFLVGTEREDIDDDKQELIGMEQTTYISVRASHA